PFFALRLKRFDVNRHEKRRNSRLFFSCKIKSPPSTCVRGKVLVQQNQARDGGMTNSDIVMKKGAAQKTSCALI
ncbi:MAG: hypothetical protein ACTHY0_06750, partial [Mammaliicoccus vitulinus]